MNGDIDATLPTMRGTGTAPEGQREDDGGMSGRDAAADPSLLGLLPDVHYSPDLRDGGPGDEAAGLAEADAFFREDAARLGIAWGDYCTEYGIMTDADIRRITRWEVPMGGGEMTRTNIITARFEERYGTSAKELDWDGTPKKAPHDASHMLDAHDPDACPKCGDVDSEHRHMTPGAPAPRAQRATEALATALLYGIPEETWEDTYPFISVTNEFADRILAALPPGWHLVDPSPLLDELQESPLPGARYAYTVVKRFMETGR